MTRKILIPMLAIIILALALSSCKLPAAAPAGIPMTPTIEISFPTTTAPNTTPVVQSVPTVIPTPTVMVVSVITPIPPVVATPVPYTYVQPARPQTYTIQKDESPYCIARRYDLDPDSLLALNGLTKASIVQPGDVLKIPQTGNWTAGARSLASHPATYTVKSGDTIYRIACAVYGDVDPLAIAAANGLAAPYTLSVGQVLQIP
ncbi:MAG TPA: LysM domain-containing protein [Anaerolineaceae bacterium]|jgi:LysM repeat protein|nr:LysM domain-containing protein [Anaerolineaceae bacterium]